MFSADDEGRIVAAIQAAEKVTSGEIMVHLEKSWPGDPYQRAVHWFHRLGLQKTQQRNGILLLLIEKQKRFALVGDEGIHRAVGQDFWERAAGVLNSHLKEGKLAEGLCATVAMIGEALATYFPYTASSDRNELPDSISHL